MKMLEDKINDPNIWNDREGANKIVKRCSDLKKETSEIIDLRNEINDNIGTVSLLEIEYDENVYELMLEEVSELQQKIEKLELKVLVKLLAEFNTSAFVQISIKLFFFICKAFFSFSVISASPPSRRNPPRRNCRYGMISPGGDALSGSVCLRAARRCPCRV